MGQAKIQPQLRPQPHNIRLAERNQRSMNLHPRTPLDAALSSQIRHVLESVNKLRPAIRIPRIIQRIHTNEDIGSLQYLRPSQRIRKKNRISRRNVSNRNPFVPISAAERDFGTSISAVNALPPKRPQINQRRPLFARAQSRRHARSSLQFHPMPLPVIERQRITLIPLPPRQSQTSRRIQPTAQQTHSSAGSHTKPNCNHHAPTTSDAIIVRSAPI